MTTPDDKRLQDQVNAANNAGATCGRCGRPAEGFATIGATRYCHGPQDEPTCYMRQCWDNSGTGQETLTISTPFTQAVPTVEVHCAEHGGPLGDQGCIECERAYGEVGSANNAGAEDFSGVAPEDQWLRDAQFRTGVWQADDTPPCGSCGEPSIHVITLRGEPMPVCLRHLNHWRTPADDTPPGMHSEECVQHRTHGFAACTCTPPDSRSEVETLTPSQRARFMEAADAALRMRRAVLLLAEHATGHRKQVHGDRCEDCGLDYPCVTVKRAAGPVFDAVGDLPSQRPARHDADREDGVWFSRSDLVRHDADIAAAKAAGAAEVVARTQGCHHCGRLPEVDGDHTCPCPLSDSECLEHTLNPVERWLFGDHSAAILVARVSSPWEQPEARDSWAPKMLTDRDLFEQEVAQAQKRLAQAIAHVRAALTTGGEGCE